MPATDVEESLAAALSEATRARQWDVVKVLAEELRAQRLEREGVADLLRARRTKGR